MANFANYQNQNDYGTDFTRRKAIDLNEYRLADPKTQIFNGNVARVIVAEGKYGLQWGVTIANEQSKQKATFYISAESTSILAQQLLIITTGGLVSNEKTITTEQGNTFTVVDNIKGSVSVVLHYVGQSQKDTPIYNALSFFYADGFSIEEKQRNATEHQDIAKSFNVALAIQNNQKPAQTQMQQPTQPQTQKRHYANSNPSQAQTQAQMKAYAQMTAPVGQPLGNLGNSDDIPF